MNKSYAVATLMLALALAASGCATKKYVRQEVLATEDRTAERIDVLQSQMEDAQMDIARQDQELEELSGTARDALERAIAAGKLAEGKFVFERILSGDDLRFGFDDSVLSAEAKQALDEFGGELVELNQNLFVEIQGHTDDTGPEEYNLRLGEERAEAVRRYLNRTLEIPLHRMSVVSYGEAAPIADNDTRDNRALNRRVNLVVLK